MRLEIGQPADTLVLANGAFFDDTGGQWVFVVDASGDFADKRAVRFGRRNPEGIEVLEGLSEGERSDHLELRESDDASIESSSAAATPEIYGAALGFERGGIK